MTYRTGRDTAVELSGCAWLWLGYDSVMMAYAEITRTISAPLSVPDYYSQSLPFLKDGE